MTRLERYASCAFAHFLAYGLRLRERQEYEFKPLDWGNLFHRAMEHFARKAEILSVPVTEITDEMRRNLVEESVEESIVDYENTILYSTKRREYLITRNEAPCGPDCLGSASSAEDGRFYSDRNRSLF